MLRKTLITGLMVASLNAFAGDVTIKFSHVVAEATPKGQMALKFKELVESRSNGSMKVEVFPNSQLFTDEKVLEAMLLGDVQLGAPSLSKFDRYTKKLQIFDLPFLFENMEAVDRFQNSEAGAELLTSLEKQGLVGLGYLHNGLKQMSLNGTEIHLPGDLKGKKMRIQASDVLQAQFDAVGAISIKKPFSEVFTLLQTKAIDGTENPWSNTYSQKFYEVQDNITETDHGLLDYMVVSSKQFVDSLDDEQKQIFNESMKEAIAHGNQLSSQQAMDDRQKVIDSGRTKVIQLTAEERAQWVEVMQPVWKKFEKDIGAELIDAAYKSNSQ